MAVNLTNSYDLAEKLFKFCSSTITYLDDEDNYHKYLVMVGNTPFEILIGYSKHKNTSIRLIDRQYDEEIYSGTIKNDDDLRDINVCSYEISEIVYDIITNDVSGEEYFSETQLLRNRPVKSIFDEESQEMINSEECSLLLEKFNKRGSEVIWSMPIHESLILNIKVEINESMSIANLQFTIINIEDYSRIDKILSYTDKVDETLSIHDIIKDMTSKVENKYEKAGFSWE